MGDESVFKFSELGLKRWMNVLMIYSHCILVIMLLGCATSPQASKQPNISGGLPVPGVGGGLPVPGVGGGLPVTGVGGLEPNTGLPGGGAANPGGVS